MKLKKDKTESRDSSELLVVDKLLYLKDGDNYIEITDSNYLDTFTNNMKIEGNEIYNVFQEKIRNSFDKKNIKKENIVKTIDDIEYNLIEYTLVVPKEEAKDIISSYIKDDFEKNLKQLVSETIDTQEKTNENKMSEEDKVKLKEEMESLLNINLEEKIKNMEFSDISIKVDVDKSGYIRYRNESYSINIEGKTNQLENITEYLSFGKDVKITNPNDIKIKDLDLYLNEQKEKEKKQVKSFILENPDKEINLLENNVTE